MSKVELNEEKLMELTGKVFENVSAAGSVLVSYIGDQTDLLLEYLNSDLSTPNSFHTYTFVLLLHKLMNRDDIILTSFYPMPHLS